MERKGWESRGERQKDVPGTIFPDRLSFYQHQVNITVHLHSPSGLNSRDREELQARKHTVLDDVTGGGGRSCARLPLTPLA
ncbi:hypothetical protein SKAU_G00330090 [Synaphobranchus kaupii]|uniref:Uncharacterized protein n=1 Tax=Synaphobranchus kaupii TaxID=118154 RepID=A0A9Q1IKM5_SYNKA|nr:hypothetical protein SKAU_G00330090 [Synaphobranchus kaupii]